MGIDAFGMVQAGIGGIGLLRRAAHFAVDESSLDGPETLDSPAGDNHLVDQIGFDGSCGLAGGDVLVRRRTVLRAVNP